jgi:hypothetical protein
VSVEEIAQALATVKAQYDSAHFEWGRLLDRQRNGQPLMLQIMDYEELADELNESIQRWLNALKWHALEQAHMPELCSACSSALAIA